MKSVDITLYFVKYLQYGQMIQIKIIDLNGHMFTFCAMYLLFRSFMEFSLSFVQCGRYSGQIKMNVRLSLVLIKHCTLQTV